MNEKKLIIFLINTAFGNSAVRNQGEGVIQPIRDLLINEFDPEEFFLKLKSKTKRPFLGYLNSLTKKLNKKTGYYYKGKQRKKTYTTDKIRWGTARKCINLFFRNFIYNKFICDIYKIKKSHFKAGGIFNKLELPLDSYAIKGLKKGLKKHLTKSQQDKYGEILKGFTISSLRATKSGKLQKLATLIAKMEGITRVDLDIDFWRDQENELL